METLQTLGIALGLASLAGLNLYLTVFATGLSIQQGWVTLAPQYQQLDILAHPAIIAISGVLYVLQFFADKVPWVDSLWDGIHTVIRPVGGALLAVRALGSTDPAVEIIAALLLGTVSLTVHSMKAGTRLLANHSPEPFSNIALSVGEDVAVIGGLALMNYDPVLALVVFGLIIASLVYLLPKFWRAIKVHSWLIWKKLTSPPADELATEMPEQLPPALQIPFHTANLLGEKVAWAVPCVSATARRIPGNIFGYLVATKEDPSTLWFVAKRRWRPLVVELDLRTFKAVHEPKILSENLTFYSLEKKGKYHFVFDRSKAAIVKRIASEMTRTLTIPVSQPV
ncbi:MAG TPA: DUF4126 domain-containing protein [Chthoniobacteraceae bacterium]|nr:DUF4126 domain-containing protein [Chthoniobacteraceae bacterium]